MVSPPLLTVATLVPSLFAIVRCAPRRFSGGIALSGSAGDFFSSTAKRRRSFLTGGLCALAFLRSLAASAAPAGRSRLLSLRCSADSRAGERTGRGRSRSLVPRFPWRFVSRELRQSFFSAPAPGLAQILALRGVRLRGWLLFFILLLRLHTYTS